MDVTIMLVTHYTFTRMSLKNVALIFLSLTSSIMLRELRLRQEKDGFLTKKTRNAFPGLRSR